MLPMLKNTKALSALVELNNYGQARQLGNANVGFRKKIYPHPHLTIHLSRPVPMTIEKILNIWLW